MAEIEILDNVINTIDTNTQKIEEFLSVQNQVALNLKDSIKRLYDFTKEQCQRNNNALPELVTEGFDEEQIWQQLELQNEGELEHFLSGISKVLAGNRKLTVPITATKPQTESNHEDEDSAEERKSEDKLSDEVDDLEIQRNVKKRKRDTKLKEKRSSIIDDKFFKLRELDEYLTNEEKKETRKAVDDSDEDFLDFFNAVSDNENDDAESAKFLKYAGFFDSPESEEECFEDSKDYQPYCDNEDDNEKSFHSSDGEITDDSRDGEKQDKLVKKVKFNLTNDSDETDSLENKAERPCEDTEIKSSFETRQNRVQNRIHNLEEEAISDKPWQLKGEVTASNRPQNSLLEEFVEFDVTTRPAPIITEQTTQKLEDIILRRIKDKAWDDVEKKFKPVETPLEYKKRLILNQEKSKESLSQIYEKEYLRQKQALDPNAQEREEEEPPLHREIRQMMHSLFAKLDALANYHYTPKMSKPELKVISNIPAINMEEVAPVATTDATLLAPEEVKAKSRGDVIGNSERTATDRKRERRHKKLRQRSRQQAMEKKQLDSLKPGVNKKYGKNKDAALIKKLTNDRNITKLDETSNKIAKTSTAFFTQLQNQVETHIKSKSRTVPKKKNQNAVSAVNLKL